MSQTDRFRLLNGSLFLRPSPFANETGALPMGEFLAGPRVMSALRDGSQRVLVIGAGGLGCELLKGLALSGVARIDVIDLDTIDISNLNRQFLFRLKDVGRGKAEVAAEFISHRVPGCVVVPHTGRIQDFDEAFYRQFNVVISGLDNIEARRWLNSTLHDMVKYDDDGDPDPSTIIPLVDGGTEGFKGQARLIVPKVTSCFECSLESFPPQQAFPMCTIAETPRIPEHCIAYAFVLEWERTFPGKKLDKDSPADMQWVYERALARAEKYKIDGVTYFKTLGVVKNIIPAVASTNAIIAAACVAEALKVLTYCSQSLNTYFMYMGAQGVYTSSFEYQKKDDCVVCSDSAVPRPLNMSGGSSLSDLIRVLCEDPVLQLKSPSIAGEAASLYMQKPPSLEAALRANLSKPLRDLVQSGEVLTVTDPVLGHAAVQIRLGLGE